MKKFSSKTRYRNFINDRDRAAEALLLKTRAKIADEIRRYMCVVQVEIQRSYPHFTRSFMDPSSHRQLDALDQSLQRHTYTISLDIAQHWIVLRYYTALLAAAGEQQGIINAMGGKPEKITREELQDATFRDTPYGSVGNRSWLALDRIRGQIMDAVKLARVMEEDLDGCMARVMKCFPKPDRATSPRVMKRLVREADVKKKDAFGFSEFMSTDDWQDFVAEYQGEFIPRWRDPRFGKLEAPVSVTGENVAVYPWQLERDLTDDFVTQINNGTVAGAKKQGITDFVWLAILDNRTDHCCEKRDGLTITEIKDKLSSEWSKDECRASTPPAHFNCRCRLAPAAENLPDVPESNQAEFEDWLNS